MFSNILKINNHKEKKNNIIKIKSKQTIFDKDIKDKVILFTQFYIPNNEERYKEIKETLKINVNNKLINHIILINERKYTEKEMGIHDKKIIQIIKNGRMTFADVIKNIKKYSNIRGYIIVSNSDIFFDKSLSNIFKSNLFSEKKIYSQLRLEYDKNNINNYKLFNLIDWCVDTWIFHTNKIQYFNNINDLDVKLGTRGIDQIIPYFFYMNGFKIYNEPFFIKTYHNHHNNYRTWEKNAVIPPKMLLCSPNLKNK
jgi:hypothetical protein